MLLREPTEVRVPSRSEPGVERTVRWTPRDGFTCDCPGFKQRGRCAHADAAREALRQLEDER